MDELITIIESIGILSDRAETDKWILAGKIAEAYAEFAPYERGLTAGLCQRLRKSSDSIYGYRNAENLRERLQIFPSLSVSHFIALHDLQDRYALSDELIKEWIGRAVDDKLSVRDLRCEVALEHVQDARAHWLRKVARVGKLMTTIMLDAEGVGVPDELWQATKTVQSCVSDWADKAGEWG